MNNENGVVWKCEFGGNKYEIKFTSKRYVVRPHFLVDGKEENEDAELNDEFHVFRHHGLLRADMSGQHVYTEMRNFLKSKGATKLEFSSPSKHDPDAFY